MDELSLVLLILALTAACGLAVRRCNERPLSLPPLRRNSNNVVCISTGRGWRNNGTLAPSPHLSPDDVQQIFLGMRNMTSAELAHVCSCDTCQALPIPSLTMNPLR